MPTLITLLRRAFISDIILYVRRSFSRSSNLVRLATVAFVVVSGGILGSLGLFVYFAKDLPSPDKVVRREGFATKIYDRNGQLLYDVFDSQRRNPVDLADIPLTLRQATVAIEDKSFLKHRGFDPLTPLRIVWNLVWRQKVVGGSTLTQQLVKNVLLSSERTLTRKIKEFILTIQVERKYTKDQILQMYLNEAPYGGTAWGAESGAQTYFGKSVKDLGLAESALLAGLPQSPSQYSPYVSKKYIVRTTDVLRRMREDGYINKTLEKSALAEVKSLRFATQSGLLKAPHFVFYVRDLLTKRYGEKAVEQAGLKVTTSLDLDLQSTAQTAVTEEIDKVKYLHITNGAALVLDPLTGQILAMVGSRGWEDPDYDGKFNVITQGLRQPGSSIKPVVYLTGLRKGYTAATLLMDTQTSFPGGDKPEYAPVNYDGKFRGPMLVREALGNSINIPAVKMLSLVGLKEVLRVGYDLGIMTLEPTTQNLNRLGLSMALGGGEIRPLEMFGAYSAFANGGKKIDPVAILKVTDNSGKVLEEWKPTEQKQVMSAEEAFIISSILSDPLARNITFGPNSALNVAGRTIAVKTGTTNDKKDNWTVGWTPSVVAGGGGGNNDNTSMKQVASGITGASPIWRRIILAAFKNYPEQSFPVPQNIVQLDVDKISGYLAHDGFESKKEYFIKGTEPTGSDPVHQMTKVCKADGKLATAADIVSGSYDTKEYFFFKEEDPFAVDGKNKWQEGILNWENTISDARYHPPTDYCGSGSKIVVIIRSPNDHGQFGNDVDIAADVASSSHINKVDFAVDGSIKQTLTSSPWEVTVNISGSGNHSITVFAQDDQGNTDSRSVDIGINQAWSEATPTPTSSPTPAT